MGSMKTTLEIPDNLLKELKSTVSKNGVSMKEFIVHAIIDRLDRVSQAKEKPWMKAFGAFKHLKEENKKVMAEIDAEFGKIDPEEWK